MACQNIEDCLLVRSGRVNRTAAVDFKDDSFLAAVRSPFFGWSGPATRTKRRRVFGRNRRLVASNRRQDFFGLLRGEYFGASCSNNKLRALLTGDVDVLRCGQRAVCMARNCRAGCGAQARLRRPAPRSRPRQSWSGWHCSKPQW